MGHIFLEGPADDHAVACLPPLLLPGAHVPAGERCTIKKRVPLSRFNTADGGGQKQECNAHGQPLLISQSC